MTCEHTYDAHYFYGKRGLPFFPPTHSGVIMIQDNSIYIYIQDVSRLVDVTAGGDFLGLCDQKTSYKHMSDFGRLRSYGHFLIPVHALV